MKTHTLLSLGSSLLIAALVMGSAPAAFAQTATSTDMTGSTTSDTGTTTSQTASSTMPPYCTQAASTTAEGYFVTTDQPSYGSGGIVSFCLLDNTRTPLFLAGTHPWTITDANGNAVYAPAMGTTTATTTGMYYFLDTWNGMTGSSTPVPGGTYRVNFPGIPGAPFAAFTVAASSSEGTSTTGTTTSGTGTSTELSGLILGLRTLEGQFPGFTTELEQLITSLGSMGSTTGMGGSTSSGTIDQDGGTFAAGGSIDLVGRNFGREENIAITLNGSQVATVHADGGGNFSTGSIALPTTAGTYTYVFTEPSGATAHATITVQ